MLAYARELGEEMVREGWKADTSGKSFYTFLHDIIVYTLLHDILVYREGTDERDRVGR